MLRLGALLCLFNLFCVHLAMYVLHQIFVYDIDVIFPTQSSEFTNLLNFVSISKKKLQKLRKCYRFSPSKGVALGWVGPVNLFK